MTKIQNPRQNHLGFLKLEVGIYLGFGVWRETLTAFGFSLSSQLLNFPSSYPRISPSP
jgi:hypothetical protein